MIHNSKEDITIMAKLKRKIILHTKLKIEPNEPEKTGDKLWYPGRISSSCSTSDTLRVTFVTNLVISIE